MAKPKHTKQQIGKMIHAYVATLGIRKKPTSVEAEARHYENPSMGSVICRARWKIVGGGWATISLLYSKSGKLYTEGPMTSATVAWDRLPATAAKKLKSLPFKLSEPARVGQIHQLSTRDADETGGPETIPEFVDQVFSLFI